MELLKDISQTSNIMDAFLDTCSSHQWIREDAIFDISRIIYSCKKCGHQKN